MSPTALIVSCYWGLIMSLTALTELLLGFVVSPTALTELLLGLVVSPTALTELLLGLVIFPTDTTIICHNAINSYLYCLLVIILITPSSM